jgi:hypothetical protein
MVVTHWQAVGLYAVAMGLYAVAMACTIVGSISVTVDWTINGTNVWMIT